MHSHLTLPIYFWIYIFLAGLQPKWKTQMKNGPNIINLKYQVELHRWAPENGVNSKLFWYISLLLNHNVSLDINSTLQAADTSLSYYHAACLLVPNWSLFHELSWPFVAILTSTPYHMTMPKTKAPSNCLPEEDTCMATVIDWLIYLFNPPLS